MDGQHHGAESEEFAIAEALRRSVLEQTREEAILGDVIRASVLSHDEELARAMQAQFDFEDRQELSFRHNVTHGNNEGHWVAAVNRGRCTPIQSSTSRLEQSSPRGVQPDVRGTPAATNSIRRTVPPTPAQHGMVHVPPLPQPNEISSATTGTTATTIANGSVRTTTVGLPVTPTPATVTRTAKPTVVLDGLNVGCAFGGGGGHRFRSRGIEIALEYYRARGVYAIALVPANKVDQKYSSGLADNPNLLLRLHEEKRVAFAPMGTHDDNFLLTYSLNIDADLVSNDRFRKELDRQRGTEAAKRLRRFLRLHLVPFTFILDQFVPNPHPESLASHVHHPRDRGYR